MFAIDSYWGTALLAVSSCVVAIAGLLFTRRVVDLDRLRKSHEVGGYLLSVVGTLYAVLLGLVVVDAMTKFQDARNVLVSEADSLAQVYVLSAVLPEPKRSEIRGRCREYASLVVNKEWDAMTHAQYSPEARRAAVYLIQDTLGFEPVTENQKAIYPQLVTQATQMWDFRRKRVNYATNGVPAIEWTTLIIGGIITIFFTYFFGLENLRLQMIMTAMVAALICMNLDLLLLFGYPFSGDLCVHGEPFQVDLGIFDDKITATPGSG